MKNAMTIVLLVAAIVGLYCGLLSLVGFLTMLLWNATVSELFGWPVVTFWQAVGLLVLISLLTGGVRASFRTSSK